MTADFSQFTKIPSLPTVAVEALKLFHDPDSCNERLVSVIRKDPAMSMKLLKAANSAKYSSRGQVTDLSRAVMLMGRSNAAPLVLSFSLARQSMESSDHLEHYQKFWMRSFVQATAAEILATRLGHHGLRGESYTTSLLTGLGKLALLRAEPEKYLNCLRQATTESVPLVRAEQAMFGFSHCKLSSILLQQMGLPERCHLAIRAITELSIIDAAPEAAKPLIRITRLADAVAGLICDGHPALALFQLEESLADCQPEGVGNPLTAEEIINAVREQLDQSAQLFEISPPALPPASDLLQEALEQLSRLADMAAEKAASTASDAAVEVPREIPAELLEENGRLKRRVADLLKVARVDALTGVYNRAHLTQEIIERAAIHRLRGLALGMAVIDIDHFKKINDTYGHQAGDLALTIVAKTIQDALRDSDVVGRYGGEEFVAVLADSNEEGLAIVGERLRTKIAAAEVDFEGTRIPVTASIGLACGRVESGEKEFGERLFAIADAEMYKAKRSGRNRISVASLSRPGISLVESADSDNLLTHA